MTKGLFVNQNKFMSFREIRQSSMVKDVATRAVASGTFSNFFNVLPDPDPVLRKLGRDISVYKDLLSDSHVGSVVEQMKMSVESFEWQFQKGNATDKDVDFIKEAFEDLDFDEIIDQSLNAPLFGKVVFEVLWKKVGDYYFPAWVGEKPTEWFIFDDDNQLRLKTVNNPEGELLPNKKFILVQNKPTYENPYGERALSRCFWPVSFKRGGMKFWTVFVEKYGMPYVIGKQPRGAGENAADDLLDKLENMVQDAVAVIPDDSSVEIKETGAKGSADIYKEYYYINNSEISKAILTQTLTTEIQEQGSRAAGTVHAGMLDMQAKKNKKFPQKVVNQLIKWTIDINLGTERYPVFDIYEEDDVNEDLAQRDKTLSDQGVKFTKVYYGRKYNLKEDEFELNEPSGNELPTQQEEFAEEKEKTGLEKIEEFAGSIPQVLLQQNMEAALKPVFELAETSSTYEEMMNRLVDIFPRMETDQLEKLLQKIIFISEISGRKDTEV